MKNLFNAFKFALTLLWVLIASMIIQVISVTSPNWTPVNFLITQNPLIGRARKSLGSNIGYKWFNKNVFRTKALQFTEGVSVARDVQKLFFKECQAWSKSFLTSVRIGFKQQATQMPPYSWYIGWLLREAGNIYPGPSAIIPGQVIMSKGTLQRPADLSFAAKPNFSVDITWTDDSGTGNALATDCLLMAWFNITKFKPGSELVGTVKRPAENHMIPLPDATAGDTVHFWAYFVSADGSIVSDSLVSTQLTMIS